MKPFGPIPPEFVDQPVLMLAGQVATTLADAGTTPMFVYDLNIVASRIARLRAAMPTGLEIHYAIKANPFAPLLAAIAPMVDGFDIASGGELEKALAVKSASTISFAGPGKSDAELKAAISAGVTLNLESEGEAARALTIADNLGERAKLAVRVNPAFELRGSGMRMGGRASPFGVDAERVPALVRRIVAGGADWRGFHVYAGSQALDADAVAETLVATVDLAGQLADATGAPPPLVNLGGGFGIPYFPGDAVLDVERVGAVLGEAIEKRSETLKTARFAIELGRWLVAEAGVYLTRIVDRKESQGETFLVVDGGLHHQLAASGNFGTVVRRNYPVAIAAKLGQPASETVTIVGCLCTPLDRLADKVAMPHADVGDLVAIFLAGAYGATASPSAFLGHHPAHETLVGGP